MESIYQNLFHNLCNHVFYVSLSGCLASKHSDYRGVNQQIQPDLLLHVATEANSLGPEGCVAPTQASRSVQLSLVPSEIFNGLESFHK